ncbi:MAG TPA: hypothetical protein DIU15_09990 [Deltaproteobacteria bacterium]|nr:hypothetical protein [Deltaproteobacteria bacterium]HCP46363.1 hypothetical protein [Deltaproteobacteria bacterium]
MRFNIAMMAGNNFQYLHFLFDTARLIRLALESLGHNCCITRNNLEKDRINILVASHTLTEPGVTKQILDAGVDLMVLQSEVISDGQVNFTGNREHFTNCYLPLLQNARAVWECVPGQLPILEQLGVAGHQFPLGYHPGMNQIAPKRTKDIDFLFYGSISEHRAKLLRELQARGNHVLVLFDAAAIYRNDFIARSRVHLTIKRELDMHHLPYARICYLIANGGINVVEECPDQEWLQDCFLSAPTDQWVDLCEETLQRDDLDSLAETFRQRLHSRDITPAIGSLIEQL